MLILASTSPFRASMLKSAGIPFLALPSGVDEVADPCLSPAELALSFARQKALALSEDRPEDLVLGCDQTLEIDGRLLRKPTSLEEARQELRELSGRTHRLHSALWLCRKKPFLERQLISTVSLTMYELSPEDIESYLATGEWKGCAGAFRIEETGIRLFKEISGEYHAIIGLPLLGLIRLLRECGEMKI